MKFLVPFIQLKLEKNNTNTKIIGNTGEDVACNYCQTKLHFQVVTRNYRCGKFGEIDIICKKDNSYFFIEVKTRANSRFMDIFDVIDKRKMDALKRAAEYYILKYKLENFSHRIDLLTINNYTNEIEYFENITCTY